MATRKRSNYPVPLASLFKNLLPPDYAEKRAQIQQLQYFFVAQESDAVFQMVKVANVTDHYIHVTVPNAALSSYLRLHTEHIRQLLIENFGLDLALKISTRPESMESTGQEHKESLQADISSASCQQMKNTADYVEDETLKNALKSLSKTLLEHKARE
jgi:hypothetical protein